MSRFFIDNNQIFGDTIRITQISDVNHLKNVLRAKPGEIVDISDKGDWEYKTEIISISQGVVELRILDKQRCAREPELKAILYQGIPKGNKFETVVQKCVELGIYKIIPVICSRTIAGRQKDSLGKIDRLRRISGETVKQCRRGVIPVIEEPMDFKQAVVSMKAYDVSFFPHEEEEHYTIKLFLRGLEEKPKSVAFMIGPEGGFSDEEASFLIENAIKAVSLGKTILRTETAAPATLAMIMYELEL